MGIKCVTMSLKMSGSVTSALKLFAEHTAWFAPYQLSAPPLLKQRTVMLMIIFRSLSSREY